MLTSFVTSVRISVSEDFIYRYVGLNHGCNVKNSKKSNVCGP
jgi:hypothetical protein